MKVRSVKSRLVKAAVILTLAAIASIGLSACDSRSGSAAVVFGTKISEADVNKYVTANAQPLPVSGSSAKVPIRSIALQYLIQNQVLLKLVEAKGLKVSSTAMEDAKNSARQGADPGVVSTILKDGLTQDFVAVYLYNQQLSQMLTSRFTNADILASAKKLGGNVSVNARYGSWSDDTLSITELGKKQLPEAVTIEGLLPGDVTPAPSQ